MICAMCSSADFTIVPITTGKIKKRGIFMSLIHIALACVTFGAWLLVPLLSSGSKGKIGTNTQAICKHCGYKWNV